MQVQHEDWESVVQAACRSFDVRAMSLLCPEARELVQRVRRNGRLDPIVDEYAIVEAGGPRRVGAEHLKKAHMRLMTLAEEIRMKNKDWIMDELRRRVLQGGDPRYDFESVVDNGEVNWLDALTQAEFDRVVAEARAELARRHGDTTIISAVVATHRHFGPSLAGVQPVAG